ncbi:MAG: hypothetical protein AAB116_26400 [Candidatus Poribacteria bacterium]
MSILRYNLDYQGQWCNRWQATERPADSHRCGFVYVWIELSVYREVFVSFGLQGR